MNQEDTNYQRAFMHTIDDKATRNAYADWLEEKGRARDSSLMRGLEAFGEFWSQIDEFKVRIAQAILPDEPKLEWRQLNTEIYNYEPALKRLKFEFHPFLDTDEPTPWTEQVVNDMVNLVGLSFGCWWARTRSEGIW